MLKGEPGGPGPVGPVGPRGSKGAPGYDGVQGRQGDAGLKVLSYLYWETMGFWSLSCIIMLPDLYLPTATTALEKEYPMVTPTRVVKLLIHQGVSEHTPEINPICFLPQGRRRRPREAREARRPRREGP